MSKTVHSLPQKVRPLLAPLLVLLLLTVVYGLISLRVAAWVGGKVITRTELNTRMHIVQFIYDRQYGQDSDYDASFSRKYQRDVLDQLAEELILLPPAAGLASSEEQQEYAAGWLEWIKNGYFQSDAEQMAEALNALRLTEADLVAYFADNLLLTRLHDQQVKDVAVDEAEAKAFFEENRSSFAASEMVKVSHIVVDTRAKAEQLLTDLQAGADFAALAAATSLDQETAAIGGSLRWFERGEMQPAFEQAAFALEPGQLSDVVETDEGFHVIKMESKQPAAEREYEQVANLARQKALEAKRETAWNQYRRTLRGKQLILLFAR